MTEVIEVRVTVIHARMIFAKAEGLHDNLEVTLPGELLAELPTLDLGLVLCAEVERTASSILLATRLWLPEGGQPPVLAGRIYTYSQRKGSGTIQPEARPEARTRNLPFGTKDLDDGTSVTQVREGVSCTYVLDQEGRATKIRPLPDTASYRGRLRINGAPAAVQTTPDRDQRGQGSASRYHCRQNRIMMAATGK